MAEISEYQHQKEFVAWFRAVHPNLVRCLRLSLNGVSLPPSPKTFRALNSFKASGMVKGESDLFLAIPTDDYHGLFIEMKKEGGKLSVIQAEYLAFMRGLGYQGIVCYSFEEAKAEFEQYLGSTWNIDKFRNKK